MKYAAVLYQVIISWLLWLSPYQPLRAQTHPPSDSASCGAIELTPQQAKSLLQQANLALQHKRAATLSASTSITYVPIRPHIINRSDGTGGFSMAGMNQAMARANRHFLLNGYGIQFFFAGTSPHYIDNDSLFSRFPSNPGPASVINTSDAPNALNQYYPNRLDRPIGAYSFLPFDDVQSTRSVIATYLSLDYLSNHLIPHELGHNFALFHTFGFSNGTVHSTELVTRGAGANCTTAGDEVCDTPADPYVINSTAFNLTYVNGCPQYDPSSTDRDANGEAYSPSITNFMSYYPYVEGCTQDFTAGQYERMQAGLALRQTHTSYSLDFPPTTVIAPSNLAASLVGLSVLLTWQDKANNEMGYFIERSTAPTTGFVPVGGVAPNVTAFTDTQLMAGPSYYYRIRPSNTTTGSLSHTIAISTCPAMYTLNDGVWTDASIWSCHRVPTAGDVVQIKHQVVLPAGYVATLQQLGFDVGKTLLYGTNAQLKLGF
ncbi:hypothetical protein BH09BAC4_BH09BAC4_45310 [soil metagenome]